MTSCLSNALKMRSTEHFPNSPQFTFSAFSLGCQAFVVIFINSNHWLLPFLPRETPPPARTVYHPTADWPRGWVGPCFSFQSPPPLSTTPLPLQTPSCHLLCPSNVTCLLLLSSRSIPITPLSTQSSSSLAWLLTPSLIWFTHPSAWPPLYPGSDILSYLMLTKAPGSVMPPG